MYKAIIFDFNGTLLWDTEFHDKAWLQFARTYAEDKDAFDTKDIHAIYHGRTNDITLSTIFNRVLSAEEISRYSAVKEEIYRSLCLRNPDKFRLAPGAIDFLEKVKKSNIKRTIATASQKENVDFFFLHLHLSEWFDRKNVVCDDGTFPGKPAPDIYKKAALVLQVEPGECIVFEDSKAGIESAKLAKIGKIICVRSPSIHSTPIHEPFISTFDDIDFDSLISSDSQYEPTRGRCGGGTPAEGEA